MDEQTYHHLEDERDYIKAQLEEPDLTEWLRKQLEMDLADIEAALESQPYE